MISDVISEAVAELDRYLNDPIWDDVYCGKLRERIVRLRNEAEYLRGLLDVPPGVQLAPETVLLGRIDAQRSWSVEDRSYVFLSEAETLG
jgi:hypothetical protein